MQASDDLALLRQAADAAGQIARRYFGAGPRVWEKSGDQGPVTEADLAIDRMLRRDLLAARPGYGWLSEESPVDPARLQSERMFVIDPIDGTRAFVEGQHGFAHALAVVDAQGPLAAVVHLPMLGLTYAAARGQGTLLNGIPINVSPRIALTGAQVLTARLQLAPEHWPGGVPQVERHFRSSLAWRMALVAEGQFDAMLTLRPTWHWDSAAGALLIMEAGGRVSTADGQPIDFRSARPASEGVIAAGPDLHGALIKRRRPV
ncbi:MAG: inositol monophosphatase family protein [Roseinatronobacter sp.]